MDIEKLLEDVKCGAVDANQAAQLLKELPYQELGYAKLDHHRKVRSGFGEVIYCSGKSMEHLIGIYKSFHQRGEDVLGTRASLAQFQAVQAHVPGICYDPVSKILKIHNQPLPLQGRICVCTGGTSDIGVAEEAAQTAEFFGTKVDRVYDVGVAGIHRLFAKLETIRQANCIVAVAGMEGALPGVLAGLVDQPIVGVPTSVGYGANFQGLSALLTMLNACAEGISVVNIDNGFGAGYMATQINRLALGNAQYTK